MVVTNTPAANTDEVFEQFDIEFDAGPEPVFHGGELISGQLKIKLKNEATLNAIHLQFKGKAVWLGSGKKADKEGQTEKIYFDKNFVLLERPPGHPEPGHFKWNARFAYSLPFECPLPIGCESSYESPFAYIRYYARAILEKENQEKFIAKKAFSIVSPPDLHHLVPPPSEPLSRKETVRFGGCCCRSRIDAEIQLPKSTFAPGERIVGTFSMDSRTAKQAADHIEVRLLDWPERILPDPVEIKKDGGDAPPAEADNVQQNVKIERKSAKVKSKPSRKKGNPQGTGTFHRVVAGGKLDPDQLLPGPDQPRKSRMITQHNVTFITVPPVIPTIKKEVEEPFVMPHKEEEEEQLEEGQQRFSKLLESPSTATILARREPFIGVKYSLQIALGTHILLEIPIEVHPIPIYAKEIGFHPFAGGAQRISEPDEAELRAHGGPFTFTPLYPVYLDSMPQTQPSTAQTQQTVDALAQRKSPPNGTTVVPEPATTTRVVEIQQVMVPNGSRLQEDGAEHVVKVQVQQPAVQIEKEIQQPDNAMEEKQKPEDNNNIVEPKENGEIQTVEELQTRDGQTVRRIVEETYEVQNDDGSKTTIHKTTEQVRTMTTMEEGSIDHHPANNHNNAAEDGVISEQQENNQQMDVSMSG